MKLGRRFLASRFRTWWQKKNRQCTAAESNTKGLIMKKTIAIIIALLLALMFVACQKKDQNTGQKTEVKQCANCGMNTQMAPKWEQKIEMKDGTVNYYCGPRCMFKHVLDNHFGPQEMARVEVKEYYNLSVIDGTKAWYVIGSDVLGPMGNELIPFESENAALEFKRDHHGEKIVQWDEVDMDLIRELVGMQKMK